MKTIQWIKTLNRKIRYPIPIILDTQGPEIRTGVLARPMKLEQGMRVILVRERNPRIAGEIEQIEIGYEGLSDSVADGDTVRIDNGLINLSVESRDQLGIVCRVLDGGELGSRKHVNLPGVHVNLPTITPKDKADIEFGLENDIDFVAQSFV
ncbi:MAG TPA: pyruvate kinase, partial [Gammaproteobacteria bacterium]|nr:pyruvate kinase [Gammaproteobacteria bacterium]